MKSTEHAKILIVEDEGIIANNLASRLSMAGYDVTGIAESADDVMEKIRERVPELILMDIHIKGSKDGIETTAALRERSDIPVIYLTAYSDQKTIDRAKVTGASGFLTKPIQYAALGHAIEMAISKHHVDRKVREEREWMLTVLDTVKDAVLLVGGDRHIQFLNPAAEKLTGWKNDDARGLDVDMILPLAQPPPDAAGVDSLQLSPTPERPWQLPGTLLATNLSGELFRIRADPTYSSSGEKGVGAAIQAGGPRSGKNSRNEQEVDQRQKDKMQAVGSLAAGVAHDFNNLLFIILGYTDELLKQTQPGDSPEDALKMIRKAGETAATIAEQLLTFSRKESSGRGKVDLNEVFRSQEKLLRRLAGPGVIWELNIDPDLQAISADQGQMEQVLANLVTNARDAMPDGGKLALETRCVDDPANRGEKLVVLRLKDSGIGMSAETARQLFKPFFTTKGAGTGLGLAIVQNIVADLNGTIQVESKPGKGARFTITLPCASARKVLPAHEARRESSRAATPFREVHAASVGIAGGNGTATVLLIEDDSSVRHLVRDYLKDGGFGVLEAGSAEEGICVANDHSGPIDLLITDVVMPNVGGFEIAHALSQVRPGMKTLFISGYAADFVDGEHLINGERVSPEARFLLKPFVRTELLKNVKDLLGRGVELTARAHH